MRGKVIYFPTDQNTMEREPEAEEPREIVETHATTHHAVLLTHLFSSGSYIYQVMGDGRPLSNRIEFKTLPEGNNAKFSFAVLGDSGTASDYQKRIAEQMANYHPDFFLHTGDVIYVNRNHASPDMEFQAKFFSIYGALIEHIPFFPVLGNHDTYWNNGEPYLENFYVPRQAPGYGRYYSFNVAQAHFDALDSNESLSPESPQYEWFKADLAKSHEPVKIVYFHHPVYSSGYHGSTLKIRQSLAPLFRQFHVTLVFNGHDHDYERTKPIQGTTYVVTGGGGAPLYPAAESSWTAHSETVYNFVLCRVNGGKLHLDAVNDSGRVFDRDDIAVNF